MTEVDRSRLEPDVLVVDVTDGIATLTLNRPAKRNALNGELVDALHDALGEVAGDPGVRLVAIRGEGKDFCAGADLAELAAIAGKGSEESLADAQRMGDLFVAVRTLERPVVAVVQGKALAGGAGLATACDLVLAREDAVFGYPEVHLGFVPAMVMAILRRKVGESRAFELVARGRRIDAAKASELGLVNQVIPEANFDAAVAAYLEEMAALPPSALALTKRLLYGLDGMHFEEAIARGAEVNAVARLTEACREGVRRFLEGKRRS
ncbi:MAG: enoyl-CoA hydratase/isomerase family protein [Gemmatimonadales bacterium]|jgi:methylglutaconyl-CoA hydratase|nr:MAG: enoyl-CoA hydratase/isomerase family protein [Gemmatimonadales bacterium]